MKKVYFAAIAAISLIPFVSKAQWLPNGATTGNIYYYSGNVGISTNMPVSPLTIGYAGTVQSSNGITLGVGQNNIELLNSTYGSGFGAKIYGVDSGNGLTTLRIATRGNSTAWTDALSITAKAGSTGNAYVGIGTTTPDELLSVNGTIHSKEVKINLSGLPDYVFKRNYHLPTLAEVKTYIDKNSHLPEIPSAQEVEKNGLNLGEMNKLLLKKVEELTLYLIDKDKEVKGQQKEINQLKQQQALNQIQQQQIDDLKKQLELLSEKIRKN
ncbi:hypothetical protein [Mucilaginibacter boryungensis]|uniref:Uncharacterized protein n=1 Tax=Mucilaginibacter boryungensis TaxID=768480 RepID=A0ABR9XM13_9SPHI|nr:hypothetical protein [Mucilaginibacter boryungensis]MBE9668261.1 hypothetical protein [Mucilaginibacter boryungensis]